MAFSSRGQGDFREGRFDGEGGMRCDGEAFRPVGPVGDGDGEFPATGNGCVEVKWVAESVEFQIGQNRAVLFGGQPQIERSAADADAFRRDPVAVGVTDFNFAGNLETGV